MTFAPHPAELLAPAGDRASLQAALLAGADAVYLGGTRFSARASATNFDTEGLTWARRVTRRLGRRLYVAFNTIVFDSEWGEVEATLDFLESLQPDAIIVQDLGLLHTLQKRGSRIPRHLSTQGAWDGSGGTSFLRDLGIERVILPRETPIQDIAYLVERSPFEIEVFVHGAHCYSVSGQCHWSAHLGPRSGNRGTCAQPCRRGYEADGKPATALFSPKDLRLIRRVQALSSLGVSALKIEGRLKNAKTIRRVVQAYRSVLDGKASPEDVTDDLDLAFSREWCEGFLDGPPSSWRTEAAVGHLGLRVGEVVDPLRGGGRILIRADRPVRVGTGLSWNEADGRRDGRRGDRLVWTSGEQGLVEVRFRCAGPSHPGTILYATASDSEEDPCSGWNPQWNRVGLSLRFEGREGSALICHYDAEGAAGKVESDAVLQVSRGAGIESVLADKFGRLGEEHVVEVLDTNMLEHGLFLPPSALKALRRRLLDEMGEVVGCPPAQPTVSSGEQVAEAEVPLGFDYAIRIYQHELVNAFLQEAAPPLGWVLPLGVGGSGDVRESWKNAGCPIRYWIPRVFGPFAVQSLAAILDDLPDSEFLCFSWAAFELASRFPRHTFSVEGTFNISNQRAACVVLAAGIGFDAGPEASSAIQGANRVLRVNPLVSSSRFPVIPGGPSTVRNDRGDVFHLYPLGAAAGLFLERWPDAVPGGLGPVRADVFVAPGESPASVVDRLRVWFKQ